MSNPQPQGASGSAPQQQQTQLLKADDVPKLQCLSEDMKQKYRPVVHNLWNIMQTKPQGSVEHNQARQKLQDWSTKLIAQERQYRLKLKAQQQQNQGQTAQPAQSSQSSQPSQPSQQPPSQPSTEQPPSGQQQQAQRPQAQQQQQPQQQQQQPPQQQQALQQAPPNPAQGQRPPQANQQAPQIDPEIVKHVSTFKYFLPANGPQEGTPEGDGKIKEMRNSYLMALNKQHKATQRIKMMNNMLEQRQKAGQEIPQELLNQKTTTEKEYSAAKDFVDTFRKKQAQNKAEQEQRRSQQQQNQGQPQQTPQPAAQQQRQPSQPNIKEEPQVKVEAGMSQGQGTQQFVNMQGGTPQQTQPPSLQTTQAPPSGAQQPMRQPPTPQNQAPNQQFAQPGQPQAHQQPPRPQINPHQANQMQHQQTNSPHPQSASSNAAGPPVPLSHQAAVSAAQRSYSNPDGPRTTTPMQPSGQGSFHTPGSREREQLNNPKMPIPRQLNVTQPSPVGMGQARPTMSGPTNGAPGPMGQPVITKFPPFQLEGEGDRVLSKRKLDELVRQVTGGSEEALTPEVEEAILQLADDFVDTVISNACKLSKLRESPQLDVRDMQLVLERNYNIRIPGYASDEVRTVRRLVPAAGWTQKMNAVQAAKVMGGKTDI